MARERRRARTAAAEEPDEAPITADSPEEELEAIEAADAQENESTHEESAHEKEDEQEDEDATESLYTILAVSETATIEEIRRAYRKLALSHHPDKLTTTDKNAKQAATETFQKLSQAYAVLSDADRRARYDASGSLDDSISGIKSDDVTWNDFFRTLFDGCVTEETIGAFEKTYKFSEEERKDVLAAYMRTKGDVLAMVDVVPLAVLDDMDRFTHIVQAAINAGEVEKYRKFPQVNQRALAKRRRELEAEAKEVEADKAAEEELSALIQKKNKNRFEDLVGRIEEKYVQKQSTKKKKLKR